MVDASPSACIELDNRNFFALFNAELAGGESFSFCEMINNQIRDITQMADAVIKRLERSKNRKKVKYIMKTKRLFEYMFNDIDDLLAQCYPNVAEGQKVVQQGRAKENNGSYEKPLIKELTAENFEVEEDPMIKKPKVEEPTIKKSKIEEFVIQKPKVEGLSIKKNKVEELALKKTNVEKLAIKRLKVEKLTIKIPKVTESLVKQSMVEEPILEEPMSISDKENLDEFHSCFLITETCNFYPAIKIMNEWDQKQYEESGDWVPIGTGLTLIQKDQFMKVAWESYTKATRTLLLAAFPRKVLATHSLSGKQAQAFPNKPAKNRLDPDIVSDIVIEIAHRFRVKEGLVRNIITAKCAYENKMLRMHENRMQMGKARYARSANVSECQ